MAIEVNLSVMLAKRKMSMTELADKNEHYVIVPVIVEGHGVWQKAHISSNIIATVFGRKKASGDIKRAFENNEVLYMSLSLIHI